MLFSKNSSGNGKSLVNTAHQKPVHPFFELKAVANNGEEVSMNTFKGKKIMIVNVASNCGYTGQYDELEKLYQENKNKLVILGFPSNNFKNQEAGSDKEIAQFCRLNFGVTFPLFKKTEVLKPEQQEIFQWLSDEKKNGWNNQVPVWNFSKYIVDENGSLKAFFGPSISPLSNEVKVCLV